MKDAILNSLFFFFINILKGGNWSILEPLKKFPEVLLFQAILYTVVGVIAYAIKPPTAADLNIEEEEETVEAIV